MTEYQLRQAISSALTVLANIPPPSTVAIRNFARTQQTEHAIRLAIKILKRALKW